MGKVLVFHFANLFHNLCLFFSPSPVKAYSKHASSINFVHFYGYKHDF